jgi:putative Holliday junction resolvase
VKAIGLDIGDRSCGIAISDELKMLARGLETIYYDEMNYDVLYKRLDTLLKEEKIDVIVIGYPLLMDGSIGSQAEKTIAVKKQIESRFEIDIKLLDERYTSKIAKDMMRQQNLSRIKRQKRVDEMAATIILQNFLNMN